MDDRSEKGKDRIVNLSAKMSEDDWSRSGQRFFEDAATYWFKWLGWLFALGGVAFISEKTGSIPLKIISALSYYVLLMYFTFFIASMRIEPYHSWALSHKTKFKRRLALAPAFAIAVLATFGIMELIDHVIAQVELSK